MLSKGIRKYVMNPAIGLLPFVLFIILRTINIEVPIALVSSFVFTAIGEFLFRKLYKSRGFSLIFYISGISILVTFIVWLFTYKHFASMPFTYLVIYEASMICLFMVLRLSKTYIATHFFRQKSLLQKALLNEFFASSAFIQYGLTLHIFTILIFRQFQTGDESWIADIFVYAVIPIFLTLLLGIYQTYKISSLSSKLRKEEWLPIVTEKGEVTGRIAKSVSLNMKNKFLHPVVRVALVADSKVYLQERPENDVLNPRKLDYPFEKYMLFNHEINLAARNSIRQMVGDSIEFDIKFLLKYVFENDDTKRLIFLFVARVKDEDDIKRKGKMNGKFWTVKQMEEGFADEIYSECFELEFEYLKNMVLIPNDIVKPSTGTTN